MTATAPTGTAGAGGAQASTDGTTAPSTTAAPPEADFLQRARENPEWAETQVRQFQSTADRAEAERQKLVERVAPIEALLEQYGGATLAAAVENYRAIRNSQQYGEEIQEFERTGQLPTRKGSETTVSDEDEYKTPEEREMEAIRAELAELKSNTNAAALASGRTVLQNHMETVFGEYGFTSDDKEKMRTAMTSQFETWQNMGDPGVKAMKSLMTPAGLKTVRGIMLSDISPEALRAAAANADLRKREGLSGLSTDGPSGTSSTGTEPPPVFKTAAEAARWARANPDGHDSY